MAQFLTTKSVSSSIDNIIKDAKEELFIVSPYLKVSSYYLDKFAFASKRKVHITFIYGKTGFGSNVMNVISQLDNVTILYRERLHSKCYFNEKSMVITSMNLHEFSENNNDEMGILVTKWGDGNIYKEARAAVMEYAAMAKTQSDSVKMGFCIRCSEAIPVNLQKPYCKKCLDVWREFGNRLYDEKVCHICGGSGPFTMDNPLCDDCRKRL